MPAPKLYLSSTLKDLEAERKALTEVLGSRAAVSHSYRSGEHDLITHCLNDVADCDIFVLILGLRYGYVPTDGFDNPKRLSITELEYQCALAKKIPRFVFIKSEDAIRAPQTDMRTKEHPAERIDGFRERVQTGADQTPAVFEDPSTLKQQALEVLLPHIDRLRRDRGWQNPPASDLEAVRAGYRDWLIEECERIVLLGLGARDRQNVRLGQVYVPALTNRDNGERQEPRKASSRGGATSVDDANDATGIGREPGEPFEPLLHRLGRESVYVPGAPGSGKSTFCRWVALSVASGDLPAAVSTVPEPFTETLPTSLHGRFPLLCPLREWSADTPWIAGNGQWRRQQLEAAIDGWIRATRPGGLTAEAFREVLANGRALLILDGVDEIPERVDAHYPRLNVLTGLADALKEWTRLGNRVLLTSRPYGLETSTRAALALPEVDLLALPRELQDVFVQRWFAAAGTRDAAHKAAALIEHLDGRSDLEDLEELRSNPMLLTALCVKFDENMQLPGDFYRLYNAVADQVIYKRYLTEPERDAARLRLSAVAYAMHTGPKTHPRPNPAAEVSFDEVDDALHELAVTDPTTESAAIDAFKKREDLLSNSGLLLPRANQRAGFYHLSFQEFFAALRLRRLSADCTPILRQHMATPQWRPTLRFLFCATADLSSTEHALKDYTLLLEHLDREHLAQDPNPALLLADCLEVAHARGWNLQAFAKPFRQACDLALACVEPPARAKLWEILGRVGLDDRKGVGVKGGLPDIDWVEVAQGPFLYGEKTKRIVLPTFRISRYPLTNAQFQAFIDDGGFEDERWWEWPDRRAPAARPRWPHPNHPRERVSWFDAMAFCRWLDVRLHERGELTADERVSLPSEEQWEKAARGTDGREYPWPGGYESGRANIDETRGNAGPHDLGRTSAVGIYLAGASPYDLLDMAGNVWEWCLDNYHKAESGVSALKVVRGGSWSFDRDFARASYRNGSFHPDYRGFSVGCRVVVSPIT